MSTPRELEVYRALRDAQTRYTYFLLAAVGAAIALTINQTQSHSLSASQIPLAIAVVLWLLSFVAGCKNLTYSMSALYANIELISVQSGNHPLVGDHEEYIAAASDGIREGIESQNVLLKFYFKAQFFLLVSGSFFYLAWHILEMYLRTEQNL